MDAAENGLESNGNGSGNNNSKSVSNSKVSKVRRKQKLKLELIIYEIYSIIILICNINFLCSALISSFIIYLYFCM